MKDIFSKGLYLEGLKKIKSIGVTATLLLVVFNAISPIGAILDSMMKLPGRVPTVRMVTYGSFAPVSVLLLFIAPALVWAMFSYQNERSRSDFYHAIPQTRLCVFSSFTAAVFTWLLGMLLLSTLVNTVLWAIAPEHTLGFVTVLVAFLTYAVLCLFVAGFMLVAVMITGTPFSNFLIFLLLFCRCAP